MLGPRDFYARMSKDFPETFAGFSQAEIDELHRAAAAFRQATEAALDAGRLWEAERHFRRPPEWLERHFRCVAEMLSRADPELANALEISYLEDFAFGECTPLRRRAVKERMPRPLRDRLIAIRPDWR